MNDPGSSGEKHSLDTVASVEVPPPQAALVSFTRRQLSIVITLVFLAFTFGLGIGGFIGSSNSVLAESTLTANPEFATLENTWELIHDQWPDPATLDDSELIYGAAQGMVDAIGDTGHSAFLDPEKTAEFEQSSEGQFVGIGVEVDTRCGDLVVTSTMPDSPARAAGLKSGDIIAAVNDVPTQGLNTTELRDLILGKEGDQLTLTIDRPDQQAPLKVDVVRKAINVDEVTWRWLPDKTVQMRVTQFDLGVNQQVRDALHSIKEQGAQRLILDLRGNPGGLVSEVIGVASQFMDEGATVYEEQGRDEVAKPLKTVGHQGEWLNLALVVLVDNESASGAEVLAAALRDNGRAQLVGETTFGTGTVLSTFPQQDGSSVVLGTAFWLTPDGERVWKEGVKPDEVIALGRDAYPSRPEDDPQLTLSELQKSSDAQLKAAFNVLNEKPVTTS
jgi:carboxyl-terminal processing protease